MQKGGYLNTILRSKKTVFSLTDIAILWQGAQTDAARVRLNYYVRKGDLYRILRGFYAKSRDDNKLELATRIFTPSYVSFETVLAKEGLIFQYQQAITVATYLTREISIDDQVYSFKRIKEVILLDGKGINQSEESAMATKERAFLDTLYLNTDYHFDNLRSLEPEKVVELLPMYDNKRMNAKVKQLLKL